MNGKEQLAAFLGAHEPHPAEGDAKSFTVKLTVDTYDDVNTLCRRLGMDRHRFAELALRAALEAAEGAAQS